MINQFFSSGLNCLYQVTDDLMIQLIECQEWLFLFLMEEDNIHFKSLLLDNKVYILFIFTYTYIFLDG